MCDHVRLVNLGKLAAGDSGMSFVVGVVVSRPLSAVYHRELCARIAIPEVTSPMHLNAFPVASPAKHLNHPCHGFQSSVSR